MLALRLDTDRFSLAITGDTGPVQSLCELARGADVMVTMCGGSRRKLSEKGLDIGQMSNTDAGERAQRACVKKIVLTHFGSTFRPGGEMERAIREIAAIYNGEIVYPYELMRISLDR